MLRHKIALASVARRHAPASAYRRLVSKISSFAEQGIAE
jgi:hypothetical protein